MSVVDDVKRAKNPQEGLLAIAAGLDLLIAGLAQQAPADPWGDWSATEVTNAAGDEPGEIIIQPASPERQAARRAFALQQRLPELLQGDEDWASVYGRGGPIWLYNADRDLVLSMSFEARRAMVEDVALDDPQYAAEMSRDILKLESHPADLETGAGALAVGTITGKAG